MFRIAAKSLYLLLLISAPLCAEIKLPALLSDNMVLQQQSLCTFWGKVDAFEKVNLRCSWTDRNFSCVANTDGKWQIKIKTPAASYKAYKITINNITIKNVLIGQVWLCSGQSNMQMPLKGWDNSPVLNMKEEIAKANYPAIRMFNVQGATADTPANDCKGKWTVCNPEGAVWFSAVGYFFARELHKKLDSPVGMLNSSFGDTFIQQWLSSDVIEKGDNHSNRFNAMVAPLLNYNIKGVIWYQGENNRSCSQEYRKLFPAFINDWRRQWHNPEMPFYYAQLTAYYKHCPEKQIAIETIKAEQPSDSIWAQLRDAQTAALAMPHTGMAVIIDASVPNSIHPPDKQTVGKRLAAIAEAETYGLDLPHSSPMYKAMEKQDNKIRIYFDNAPNGLMTRDGKEPAGFAIAGADEKFYWADAIIDGNSVIVSSTEVDNPVTVRYGWSDYPLCNLYNRQSWPVCPFRTDDFKLLADKKP